MSNKLTKYLGGLFAALLFAVVTPIVNAQTASHLSYDEVSSVFWAHNNASWRNYDTPEYITTAHFYGTGVWVFSDGAYVLDSEYEVRQMTIANNSYDTVMAVTGDSILAIEAAIGLLTPEEMDDIIQRIGNQSYNMANLTWFVSPFSTGWNTPPPGGGGGLLY